MALVPAEGPPPPGQAELPHAGRLELQQLGDRQWLQDLVTGEQVNLAVASPAWVLKFHEGFGYIRSGTKARWLSGPEGLLTCTLHQTEDGRKFIKHKSSGESEWLSHVQRAFSHRRFSVVLPPARTASMRVWQLRLPKDGVTGFLSVRDLLSLIYPDDDNQALNRHVQHALTWWTGTLQQYAVEESHLRRGSRTTHGLETTERILQAVDNPLRIFPGPACSTKAALAFFPGLSKRTAPRTPSPFLHARLYWTYSSRRLTAASTLPW